MLQIPDNLRPVIAFVGKHQFWLMLGLLPCVLVPTLFVAQASLDSQIKAQQSRIKAAVAQIKGVEQKPHHPNGQWKAVVDAETERVRRETFEEWRKLWDSQETLRVWPRELGDPFIAQVTNLRPGASLDVTARTRYQTDVRELVKQLPGRMEADERMTERGGAAAEGGAKPALRRDFRLVWRPENQRQIYQSFDWPQLPDDGKAATAQILLAQEELWVYGLFCDAIKQANAGKKTRFEAAILEIAELSVGYLAAEETPGGQGQRLGQGGGGGFSGPGFGQPASRPKPAHPRFSNAGGRPSGPSGAFIPGGPPPDGPSPAADASFRDGIYVDFNGMWLTAAELDSDPLRMVHLMPFTLRMVMDSRAIEPLLASLASQPIPIDVRQLRINPAGSVSGAAAGGRQLNASTEDRKHDVTVELRGTVGLATPPLEKPAGQPQPGPLPGGAATGRPAAAPGLPQRRPLVPPVVTVQS
jgi:hypothetical protein